MSAQEISSSILEDLAFLFTQQNKPIPNINIMIRELRLIQPMAEYYDCDEKKQFVEKYTGILSQQ